jgi:serine/threonine protein kinase
MSTSDDVLVGRYRLLQEIGAGGMGVVWRAYDEKLGRDVAVKQLHARHGLDEAEAEVAAHRAMREARITARLHHPHAVPVFDVVEHHGRPCLVMQYFPSSSLAELVRGGEVLPPGQVARIGAEVASALAAAHQGGIVHRDVKPANVLVAADGEAKISDFGIAHAMGDVSLTSSGLVTGTPAYLAPEVARGEEATPASDVFSLGSTLYTVLEGHPPFGTHENPMALLHRVASGEVEPPRRAGAFTPLLLQMLAPRPQDRPTMSEVARRLAQPAEPVAPVEPVDPDEPVERGVAVVPVVPVVPVHPTSPSADPTGEDPLWAFREEQPPAGGPDGATAVGQDGGTGERRRRGGVLLALLALAAATAVVLGILAPWDDDPGAAPQAAPTSAAPTPTARASVTRTPSESPTPSPSRSPRPSSSAPAPSTTPAPRTTAARPTPAATTARPVSGTPTSAQLRAAVQDYYALLPGNLDAGWDLLTSRYQSTTARNRATYESFWGSVDDVSVSDVSASRPGSVTATVTYHFDDGRVFVERTSYRLVRDDGELKIDRSTVLSSVQR